MKEKNIGFLFTILYKNGYNSTSGGRSGYEFTEEILYKKWAQEIEARNNLRKK